jgi:hypothetical protein
MKKLTLSTVALALVVSACGGGDAADSTSTTDATPTTTTPTTTTQAETTTTTVAETTTTTGLPGEPIDFGPAAGDTIAVIGVAHDDVLNLRAAPGADQEIVAEIPNLADGLTALGNTRDIGDSFWIEVEYDGTTGWVHYSFIGYLGVTDDMTSTVIDQLGEAPIAETMLDIGAAVASHVCLRGARVRHRPHGRTDGGRSRRSDLRRDRYRRRRRAGLPRPRLRSAGRRDLRTEVRGSDDPLRSRSHRRGPLPLTLERYIVPAIGGKA